MDREMDRNMDENMASGSNHLGVKPAAPGPRVVAVVLNWRRPEKTLDCVASLAAIDRALDIVVVDNDSQDGSYARIRDGLPAALAGRDIVIAEAAPAPATAPWRRDGGRTLLLVDSGHNGGYAFGNNVGAALALQRPETAFVWILNNDVVAPNANSLDALLERMAQDPLIGVCGATVIYAGKEQRIQSRGGSSFQAWRGRFMPIDGGGAPTDRVEAAAVEAELAFVNGAAALVRREVYEQIGPMCEDLFLYCEEFDWAQRMAGRFKLAYAPDALIVHEVGGTIGTDDDGPGSPLSIYYLARNRLITLWRYKIWSLPFAIADEIKDVYRFWRRGWRPQLRAKIRALAGLSWRE